MEWSTIDTGTFGCLLPPENSDDVLIQAQLVILKVMRETGTNRTELAKRMKMTELQFIKFFNDRDMDIRKLSDAMVAMGRSLHVRIT